MDERLAALVARQRVREVEAVSAITIRDLEALPRPLELKGQGASERIGWEADVGVSALEEMERPT
jgi:hypothetical protein